jgi:type I restriction enzyme S subunit
VSWPSVTLDDVSVHIRNGASIKQSSDAKGLPITRIETIAAREINLKKCGYADVGENDFLGHRLDSGDILISHINSEKHLGKCAIYEGTRKDIVHGMNLLCLRPKQEIIFPRFLFHYLSSSVFLQMIPAITKKSVNQASFTVTAFKFLQIPLPPLTEQKRIAAILDKADAIRRKRQQAIQLADDFLRAVFLDMFGDPVTNPKGWEVKQIREVCANIVDCPHSTPTYSEKVTDYPCFRSSELQDGKLDFSAVKYVDIDVYEERIKRLKPMSGDIVYCREGARLGNLAMISEGLSPCLGQRTMLFRLDHKILYPEVFLLFLNSPGVKEKVLNISIGAAAPRVNIKDLVSSEIYCPSLKIQETFVEIHNKTLAEFRSSFIFEDLASGLFDSLSQKAFRGEL